LRERDLEQLWDARLWSFFYWEVKLEQVYKQNKVDLFLDSGAYSAYSQGISINLDDYIAFIKKNISSLNVYANLDVIGDPVKTWQNQRLMERAGLNPLPTFHYGANERWLRKYLDKGYDYIALGGMVPISNSHLVPWLDEIFEKYICDDKGMPKFKVHGFGLTSLVLMLRYPWYSVDSTTWIMAGRMGGVYVPFRKNGKWMYDENSWKIAVSERSPNKSEAGKHISSLTKGEKQLVLDYLEEKGYGPGKSEFRKESMSYKLQENERWLGKAVDGVREVEKILEDGVGNRYQLRDEVNIIYFIDLEKSIPEWPWSFKRPSSSGLGIMS